VAGNPRIDDLRKRIEKDPQSRLFAQLAEELRKDGDLAEAIQVAREGLKSHSSYPSARLTLGRALMDTGDTQAARKELEAAVQGAPDNILAGRLLAECLESEGRLEDAAERYRATLALSAGDKQIAAKLEAIEQRIRSKALASRAAPAIPVAEVDAEMELEAVYERPPSFVVRPLDEDEDVFEATPTEPPPIPVLEANEEFELERTYEAPVSRAPVPMPVPMPEDIVPVLEAAPEDSLTAGANAPVIVEPLPADPDTDLNSSTLAELYFNQGFTDQAIDVYRQIAEREPGNERVQARLRELTALKRHLHDQEAIPLPAAVGVAGAADAREARRAALTKTIQRLEGLQAALRKG
jgi:tetratricopeptide (TPR) repeat protein